MEMIMMEQPFRIDHGNWVTGCCAVPVDYTVRHTASCPLTPSLAQQLEIRSGEWCCSGCGAVMVATEGGGAPVMTHGEHCHAVPASGPVQA
jgi:hypothetical protein